MIEGAAAMETISLAQLRRYVVAHQGYSSLYARKLGMERVAR